MNFQDKWEENADGEKFVFTVEMQRALAAADLPISVDSLNQIDLSSPSTSRKEEKQLPDMPNVIQIDPETGKYIGQLKWFNADKGYGFLRRSTEQEIFFHENNSLVNPREWEEGQWLLYDVEDSGRRPEATELEAYQGNL